jgi:hypothetical protein
MQYTEGRPAFTVTTIREFRDDVGRGAEIVETLTAATRAEDLANAFAWFEERLQNIFNARRDAEIHQAPSGIVARQHYTGWFVICSVSGPA